MADAVSRTTSRRQLIAIGTATIVGALVLFLIWYYAIRTPYVPAFTNINSTDAVTITQELERLKTPFELADGGTTILVPQNHVDAARINVLGGELPLKGAVGFELFNNTDIGLTDFAQKINYQRALQGELARTIMALENVESARVHIALPESGIFEQNRRPAKASITLTTKSGGQVDGDIVRGVQQLVAAAVPELQAENVAILDARGQLLSKAPSDMAMAPATPEQRRRIAYERGVASEIEDALRAAGVSMPLKVKVTALRSFDDDQGYEAMEKPTVTGIPVRRDANSLNSRSDPIDIRLLVPTMPAETVRARLMEITQSVVGFDASLGDAVVVEIDPSLTAVTSAVGTSAPWVDDKAQPAPARDLNAIPFWPFALLLSLFLVASLLVYFRKRSNGAMALQQRQAFTNQLKSLLDEEVRSGS